MMQLIHSLKIPRPSLSTRYLIPTALFLVLIWHAISLAGENSGKEDITLDPITVTAERNRAQGTDLVDTEIRTPRASGNIVDSLGTLPGVQLKRSGAVGSGSALRLRGFDETRLIILKDGVNMNRDGSYGNGAVDWSSMGLESVEQIQVYRGSCPARYGNTLGGVIDMKGISPTSSPGGEVSLSYGSLDTLSAGATHSGKNGRLGWAVSAGHFETDGDLRNNFSDRNSGSGRLTYEIFKGWTLGAGAEISRTENGNPVYNRPDSPFYDGSYPDADERELRGPGISSWLINGSQTWGNESQTEDKNSGYSAFIEGKTDNWQINLAGRIWSQESREVYTDANDTSKTIYVRETDPEDKNWSLNGSVGRTLGNHTLEAGGETKDYGWGDQRVTYIDTSYFLGSISFMPFIQEGFKGQPGILDYHALYVQDTWQMLPELALELGLRQEWFKAGRVDPDAFGFAATAQPASLSENNLDPRLGLTWQPVQGTTLSARWGIAHRYPTSGEYFWWYLNNAASFFNTDFNPERALQYELGWDQSLGESFSFFARGYYYEIKDYISSVSVPGTGTVVFNIGQVEIKGVETGFSLDLPFDLTLWSNLTWQEGKKAEDPWDPNNTLSRDLGDLPSTMINAGVNYGGDTPFQARAWVSHVGSREHYKGSDLVTLKAYTLVNMSGSFRVWEKKHLSLTLEGAVENIFDESYEEEEGYPMPGITFLAGIRFKF